MFNKHHCTCITTISAISYDSLNNVNIFPRICSWFNEGNDIVWYWFYYSFISLQHNFYETGIISKNIQKWLANKLITFGIEKSLYNANLLWVFIKHKKSKLPIVQRLIVCAQILRNDYFFKVVYDLFSCHNNSKLDAKIYQTTRGITLSE